MFDEALAERVRHKLGRRRIDEKRMFGGLCFMVDGHMCCGVESDRLVFRVGPEQHKSALGKKHASPMTFTGRSLKGFVYVAKVGVKSDSALKAWIELALSFVDSLPAKKPKKKKAGRPSGPKGPTR